MIAKPDQHIHNYIYKKQTDPESVIMLRAFERRYVEAVDKLIEISHGNRDQVKTLDDWRIVEEIMKFYASLWPKEFEEFRNAIPDIRKTRNTKGYSQSKEIKYVGAIPPRLMRIVRVIFPDQEWDKRFVNKLVKKFPLFKVGGEQNLS